MVCLPPYPFKAKMEKTGCVSPNPKNSNSWMHSRQIRAQQKRNAAHRTLGIPMVWMHSHQIKPQRENRMHLTKSRELRLRSRQKRPQRKSGYISPNSRVSYGLVALTRNKATTRKHEKTRWITPNPTNSYCLIASTIIRATTKHKMHLTEPKEFLWFACSHTN